MNLGTPLNNNQIIEGTRVQEVEEQIEKVESRLHHLASTSKGLDKKSVIPIKYLVAESLERINQAIKNSDHVTGISTGLIDLDSKLSGFQNSDLLVLAGMPSMGKTTFALNLAFNACKSLNKKSNLELPKPSVGFFSLKMSSAQLITRLLSMMAKIDSTSLQSGKVSEENYNDLRLAAMELSNMQLLIDDTPGLTIASLRSKAYQLKRKHNLSILFIDYLQLIRGSGKSGNRILEISEITQGLKAIAKELDIPVIAVSQLSRIVERRKDKRPILSDLRESGSIEQDADVVMFIYREEYYLTRKEPPPGDVKYAEWQEQLNKAHNVAEILIAKHRNGAIGNVQIQYENKYFSIANLQR